MNITKKEWIDRFIKHFVKKLKANRKLARETAEGAWADGDRSEAPEIAADQEIAYWKEG